MPILPIISAVSDDKANISETATFTVPNYVTATLKFEYAIQYDYRYPDDAIAVTTALQFDGAEINRQAVNEPTMISASIPFSYPSGEHTLHFGAYSTIVGPAYSRLTGTLSLWLEYTEAGGGNGSGTVPPFDPRIAAGVAIAGVIAVAGIYWFGFRKKKG